MVYVERKVDLKISKFLKEGMLENISGV